MGNTPSKGNMNNKRKRGRPGPSSQALTLSPQPVERKKSKKESSRDDEVVILESGKIPNKSKRRSETVSTLSSSNGRVSTLTSSNDRVSTLTSSNDRVSTGSVSVVKPVALKIKALSGVSSRPRRDQLPGSKNCERRSKASKKAEVGSLIATKSGPRAEVNDGCFKVAGIVKKWVGKSDQSDEDEFYLVHWLGRQPPKANNNDDWLHRSQLKDCDEMIRKADEEFEIALEQRKRKVKKKPKFYEIISDDSDDERKKKPDQEEVTGIETTSGKVLRRRENISFSEDGKSVRNGGKRFHSATGQEPSATRQGPSATRQEPVGFDRGLKLEKVAAVVTYNGRLAYLLKFEGSNKCDLVPSSLCRHKIPYHLVDFYDKNTPSVFEEIDESDLASDALKVFKRAVELGRIHDK